MERVKELRASQVPGSQRARPKKIMQYHKPTVEDFDGSFFLISSEIWSLGEVPRKLTPEEIQELPVSISWKGPDCHFQSDQKECCRLLCQIISDMNMMQNEKFVSFPLGNS